MWGMLADPKIITKSWCLQVYPHLSFSNRFIGTYSSMSAYGPVLMGLQKLMKLSKLGNNSLRWIIIICSLQEHGEQWGIAVLQVCKKWPHLNVFFPSGFHSYLRETNLRLEAERDISENCPRMRSKVLCSPWVGLWRCYEVLLSSLWH